MEGQMIKLFKHISVLLIALLFFSNASVAFAQTADYSKSWANKEIEKWLSYKVIQTEKNGDFKPADPIKRIDMAIILNKLFNYGEKPGMKFSDIAAGSAYAADVAKAVAAGNFTGNNGKFRPDDPISRQEAAAVFARAFDLKSSEKSVLAKFKNSGKISSWSKDSVNTMIASGYMNGIPGSLFAPEGTITRAEAVKVVDSLVKDLKNKPGTYKGNINGNLVVNTKDVILENMVIKGDLYLTEGIGNGNVTLNNVKVSGRTIIKGGGENSIVLNNTAISGSLIIIKKDGKIRVVASGSSEINNIILNSGAKLEESGLTGSGFGNVDVIQLAPGQQVTLEGDFDSLDIEADGVKANIPDGSVGMIKIKEGTNGSELEIGSSASVKKLVANDDVAITGGSRIESADINSNGVVIDKKPGNITIAPNVTATVEGATTTGTPTTPTAPATPAAVVVPPPVGPGSGGTSGGNGGGNGGDSGGDTGGGTAEMTLIVTGRNILLNSTLPSNVKVNPSDATLRYTSANPAIASVDSVSGSITGIKTGLTEITVTASRSGYKSSTATFDVIVATEEQLQHASIEPAKATINTVKTINIQYSPAKRTQNKTVVFNLPNEIKADTNDFYYSTSGEEFKLKQENISNSGNTVTIRNVDLSCAPCTFILKEKVMPASERSLLFHINSKMDNEADSALLVEAKQVSMNLVSTVTDLACYPEDDRVVAYWTAPIVPEFVVLKYRAGTGTWATCRVESGIVKPRCNILDLLPDSDYEIKLEVTGGINAGESNIATVHTNKKSPLLLAGFADNIANNDIALSFSDDLHWRNSIYALDVYNGLSHNRYLINDPAPVFTVGMSKIIIKRDVFKDPGKYKLAVHAVGYSDAGIMFAYGPVSDFACISVKNTSAVFSLPTIVNAESITIKQSTDNGNTWVESSVDSFITPDSTAARCIDLLSNTEYLFKLAVKGGFCDGDSNTVKVVTQSNIQDFSIIHYTPTVASLSSTAPGTGMTSAKIQVTEVKEDGTNTWQDATEHTAITSTTTIASITGLNLNTLYKARLVIAGGVNAGYSNETTFTIWSDAVYPSASVLVTDRNDIALVFNEPVQKSGIIKICKPGGYQMGSSIDLSTTASGAYWIGSMKVVIPASAGDTRLDNTDARMVELQIEGVTEPSPQHLPLLDANISPSTFRAYDTKNPTVVSDYIAKAGSTADNDMITFYFSESMNANTIKNLNNYKVTTAAGAYYANTLLSSYGNDVSVDSVASDNKSIKIRIKGGKAAADDGLSFSVQDGKDMAGNTMIPAIVSSFYNRGPYVTAVRAIAVNKVELEFNQEIGLCSPGTFLLKYGASPTSLIAAAFIFTVIDGKKVVATLDRDMPTDFANIYLHVLNSSMTKDVYDAELTVKSGILASGPAPVLDNVRAKVKSFTATAGGIIIEFSELMTTIAENFALELELVKDTNAVLIQATSISAINGGSLAAGFTKLLISGLESGKEYRIQLHPMGVTRDKSEYHNWFETSEVKYLTPK
jgi:hypothetical protein